MYCSLQLAHWFYSSTLHSWFLWRWNKIPVVYLQNYRPFMWRTECLSIWHVHFWLNYLCSCGCLCVPVLNLWVGELRAAFLGQTLMEFPLCNLPAAITETFCILFFLCQGGTLTPTEHNLGWVLVPNYLLLAHYKGHGNWSQMEVTLYRGENKGKLPFLLEAKAICSDCCCQNKEVFTPGFRLCLHWISSYCSWKHSN